MTLSRRLGDKSVFPPLQAKMAPPAPTYKRSNTYSWRATSEPPKREVRPVYVEGLTASVPVFKPSVRSQRPAPGMTPSNDLAIRQARATLGRLEVIISILWILLVNLT